MSWKTFTPADKNRITADWLRLFPGFGVYKPMHLLRRTGPLLSGVLLARSRTNDSYHPVFHVHNLTREFPCVSLALAQRVPHEYVHVEWHEGKHADLAARLKGLIRFPLSGPISLEETVRGFEAYLRSTADPLQPNAHEDLALICGWHGKIDAVDETLSRSRKEMEKWPGYVLQRMGGLDAFLEGARVKARDRRALQGLVEAQIAAHRLSEIPASG